jgi:hypothetical protein
VRKQTRAHLCTRSWSQVLTGESWSEAIARPLLFGLQEDGNPLVVGLFFTSFIILHQIVLVNVVVAVLLDKIVSHEDSDTSQGAAALLSMGNSRNGSDGSNGRSQVANAAIPRSRCLHSEASSRSPDGSPVSVAPHPNVSSKRLNLARRDGRLPASSGGSMPWGEMLTRQQVLEEEVSELRSQMARALALIEAQGELLRDRLDAKLAV